MREPFGAQLLGIDDVRAFAGSASLEWLVGMWRDAMHEFRQDQQAPSASEPVEVVDFEPGVHSMLITRPQQDGIVALVPFPGEWQVWEFFHDRVVAHRSFAALLDYHARRARQRTAQRAELAQPTTLGDLSLDTVGYLAASGDPRVLDAAREILCDPSRHQQDKARVAMHLGFLGDPRAVPMLRDALARVDDPASGTNPAGLSPHAIPVIREQLRYALVEALDSCGDPHVLEELERKAALDPSGRAAQYLKRRTTLPRW